MKPPKKCHLLSSKIPGKEAEGPPQRPMLKNKGRCRAVGVGGVSRGDGDHGGEAMINGGSLLSYPVSQRTETLDEWPGRWRLKSSRPGGNCTYYLGTEHDGR